MLGFSSLMGVQVMDLGLEHVEVHVTALDAARRFYVDQLGLEVLDDLPALDMFAVRAGQVRISIFGGYEPKVRDDRACGTHLIFRVPDLDEAIEQLTIRGVVFTGGIVEAGGFIRDIATVDPDGNTVEFAEYLRDPLVPA
jgi:catechol 2,3-dioxygenase-like lactoylglutathione lyase family enzyme